MNLSGMYRLPAEIRLAIFVQARNAQGAAATRFAAVDPDGGPRLNQLGKVKLAWSRTAHRRRHDLVRPTFACRRTWGWARRSVYFDVDLFNVFISVPDEYGCWRAHRTARSVNPLRAHRALRPHGSASSSHLVTERPHCAWGRNRARAPIGRPDSLAARRKNQREYREDFMTAADAHPRRLDPACRSADVQPDAISDGRPDGGGERQHPGRHVAGDKDAELRMRFALRAARDLRELAVGERRLVEHAGDERHAGVQRGLGMRRITQQQLRRIPSRRSVAWVSPRCSRCTRKMTARGSTRRARGADQGEDVERWKWEAFWERAALRGRERCAPAHHATSIPPMNGIFGQKGMPRTPDEVVRATAKYEVRGCEVKTNGARLEISFPGVTAGVFTTGNLQYDVFKDRT